MEIPLSSSRRLADASNKAKTLCVLILCAAIVTGIFEYYTTKYAEADEWENFEESHKSQTLQNKISQTIMKEVLTKMHEEIKIRLDDMLPKLIEKHLEIYDADKTGRPDFALEKSGGAVVAVRDATPFDKKYPNTSPRFIIQECVHPTECWAFAGSKASVIIRLREPIFVQGVTLEHIHVNQSFTGDLSSAPKDFMILGMQHAEENGLTLGHYAYNVQGKPLQHFSIKENSIKTYEYIEFKVLSNHGNPDYTCIYRLRVHGKIPSDANLKINSVTF